VSSNQLVQVTAMECFSYRHIWVLQKNWWSRGDQIDPLLDN
jgi:hypothetical protein